MLRLGSDDETRGLFSGAITADRRCHDLSVLRKSCGVYTRDGRPIFSAWPSVQNVPAALSLEPHAFSRLYANLSALLMAGVHKASARRNCFDTF